jgi:hypothetical protein
MPLNPSVTLLDNKQITQRAFDEADDALRVNVITGTISVVNPSIGPNGSPAPTSSTEISGINGSGNLTPISVDNSGNQNVNVVNSVLPTGASTSSLQTTGNVSLSNIDLKVPANLTVVSTRLLTDGSGVTQPVSASSLPLPTGASTSVNQTTANTSLSSIAANTTGLATQATLSAFSLKSASAFINSPFDETVITYVGATTNIATVTYKLATVTVNTLTLSYDGSNRLTDVVKT